MAKTIEVVISPKGEIRIETKGFVGIECEEATAELEKELGVAGRRTAKPERRQRAVQRLEAKG